MNNAKLNEFEIRKTIGKGNSGNVFNILHVPESKEFAMKAFKIEAITTLDEFLKTIDEMADHPFLVAMNYVF